MFIKSIITLGEELTRFEKAIALLSFKKIKDLSEIAKGDDMFMKVFEKLEDLCENPDMIKLIDDEKAMEYGHMMDIKEAEEKAHKSGFEEGKKKAKIKTAKKLLSNNIDIDVIVDSTGLSKEEIEKLK